MKPNIKRISEITGYSPATVSNALNRKPTVNRETAHLILQTAREIGYISDSRINSIRLLVMQKSGLIVADTPFFVTLISGIENACRESGYDTIITHLNMQDPDYPVLLDKILSDHSTANLILATEINEKDVTGFLSAACPIIIVDSWFEDMDFDIVSIDNTDSTYKATKRLIEMGHTRIGYLKSKITIKNFIYREVGYRRAMNKMGLSINPSYLFSLSPSMDGSLHDMKNLLTKRPDLPTAFLADNDNIALGACKALQEFGYRIPEDISIVGFDDMPFCEISHPPLSTIRVFKKEMGLIAVRQLVQVIQFGWKVKTKTQICTEFIERESVRQLSATESKTSGGINNGKPKSKIV